MDLRLFLAEPEPDGYSDLAGSRELDRVAHQIDQDLPQTGDVADDPARNHRIDVHDELQALFSGTPAQQVHSVFHARHQIDGLMLQLEFARFDFREIEDVIDDGQ
jgi:hypothetical protein